MRLVRAAPLVAALLVTSIPAPGGVPLVDPAGAPYRWDLATEQPNVKGGRVTYFPHAASLRDQVDGQSSPLAAIRAGVAEWEIGTAAIRFQEDLSRAATGPSGSDRVNYVGFVQTGLDKFTLAVTTVTRDGSTITDMDVALNDHDFDWDTNTPGVDGVADIQSLVTHEWGHAIGCDHVPLRTSTMYAFTQPGIISFRSIAPDDRALVGASYPNALFGSSTGALEGTVDVAGTTNDRSVHVVAVSVATGEPAASALTGPDGAYRIAGLPAGAYRVVAAPALPLASQNKFWSTGSTSFLARALTQDGSNPGVASSLRVDAGATAAVPTITVSQVASPFEPNDGTGSATPLEIGRAITARFETGGDEDWYAFAGTAGTRISVNVLSWGLGADADPALSVVSAQSGTVLLQDDARSPVIFADQIEGEDLDVRVAGFALPQTGTYFLRIRDQISVAPRGDAFYALFLTQSEDAPSAVLTVVAAAPSRLDADGVARASIVVRPRRETGDDVGPGALVTLEHAGGGSLGPVTDRGDGTYAAEMTAPLAAGRDRVTVRIATPEGTVAMLDAVTLVYLGPADAARSAFSVAPRRIGTGAGAQADVLLVPRDADGEALGRDRVVAFALVGPTGSHLLGPVDLGDGSYGDTVSGPASAGRGSVTAKVDGVALGPGVPVAFGFALGDVLTDVAGDLDRFLLAPGLPAKAGPPFEKARARAADGLTALAGGAPRAIDTAVASAASAAGLVVKGRAKAGATIDDPGTLRDLGFAVREAATDALAAAVVRGPRDQRKLDKAALVLANGDLRANAGDGAGALLKWRAAFAAARTLRPR